VFEKKEVTGLDVIEGVRQQGPLFFMKALQMAGLKTTFPWKSSFFYYLVETCGALCLFGIL